MNIYLEDYADEEKDGRINLSPIFCIHQRA